MKLWLRQFMIAGEVGQDSRVLMTRALAWLLGVGATLVVAGFFVLPAPAGAQQLPITVMALVACTAVVALATVGSRQPRWLFVLWPVLGTALISGVVLWSGRPLGVWAIFYFWVMVFSCYFFRRQVIAAQLAWVAVCYLIVLWLGHAGPQAASAWVTVVGALAAATALVVTLKERILGLSHAARRDTLTGLGTRNEFDERLALELDRVLSSNRPLALLMVDLDDFKRINERFGAERGDDALRKIAEIFGTVTRRIDLPARLGGSDFALIVPEAEARQAWFVAERFLRALTETFLEQPFKLTASIGVASSPIDGVTPETLAQAANQALAVAKRLGGGRAVVYEPSLIAEHGAETARRKLQAQSSLTAVLVLAETLDLRDEGTSRHSQLVGHYSEITARELGLVGGRIERIRLAGVLHDVGKIAISDTILQKPEQLTAAELTEIRKHPALGARVLEGAGLEDIAGWVLAHHERPDGQGYPFGLSDQQIPIEAKILSVCDAYEAMIADRVYRIGIGEDAARTELAKHTDAQFDPVIVSAFLRGLGQAGLRTSVDRRLIARFVSLSVSSSLGEALYSQS
jgi:diguanylate cyclase (GGDEF)-like protein